MPLKKLFLRRGVARGEAGSHATSPIRRFSEFLGEKLALLGRKKVTMFSLPEVFYGPQICQKCVGGRGSAPGPRSRRYPDLLVDWEVGHPSLTERDTLQFPIHS